MLFSGKKNYIFAALGLVLALVVIAFWWLGRAPLPDVLLPDEYLRKSVEAAHALECQDAAKYLERAVASDEAAVQPFHLRTVHWCFMHTAQYDQGREVFGAMEHKWRLPALRGVAALVKADYASLRRECEIGLGYASQAISLLEEGRADQSVLSEAHRVFGSLQLCLGRLDEARTAYEKAVELDPRNQYAWNTLGAVEVARLYRIRSLDISAAEQYFLQALEIDPTHWKPLLNLASLYQDANPAKSRIYAERFLALYEERGTLPALRPRQGPEFVLVMRAHVLLAGAHRKLGDPRAVEQYEIAQSIFERHRSEILAIDGLQWPHEIAGQLEEARQFFAR